MSSSVDSYDSDNGSGFWDTPGKPIKEEFKCEEQDFADYSNSYQELLSESEDVINEREHESTKFADYKDSNNSRNKRSGQREDANKPFYVPRKPHFFEHDIRIQDDEVEVKDKRKRNERKTQDSDCWNHDLFNENEQQPKSKGELIDTYGYDIRSDSPTSIGECLSFSRERHCKRQQGNVDHLTKNVNYEETAKDKTRNDSTRSFHKESNGFKESGSYRKILPKKTYSSDEVILKMDKLSITSSQTSNKVLDAQDLDYVPATYSGCFKRESSQSKKIYTKKEKTHFKPRAAVDTNPSNCFQNRSQKSSNFKGTNKSKSYTENENTNSFNRCPIYNCNLKSNNYFNESRRIHGPLNICEKTKFELDDKDVVDNRVVPVNATPFSYSYFNSLYNMGKRANVEFPDPPDLSANHLMPCVPQQQYYLHPYYQGVYGQPYYQNASYGDIAIVKQNFFGSWASPHQSNIVPSQHIDLNPCYALLDNEITSIKCVESTDTTDEISSVPVQRTSHRYSYVRAMLHRLHSVKESKPDNDKE